MKKKKYSLIAFSLLLVTLLAPMGPAAAFEFNPNNIITNKDLTDYRTMTREGIQEFLEAQNGTLATYRAKDYFGEEKSAAEIIYEASQRYLINPQVLLVKLQKEQSLISNPNPTQYNYDWAMGYAVCDSCSVDDPRVQLFKGFGTQVDRAAWRLRYYLTNPDEFHFQVGEPFDIDGTLVIPENYATVGLYNYTPHIHGNQNFFKIWNRWFQKIYPDGTLVKADGEQGVWLIQDQTRRPFWSKVALQSRYDTDNIITISRNDLLRYPEGHPIKYSNYSIVQSPDESIYLLVNDTKKKIADQETFRYLGYNPAEIIPVTDQELAYYETGRSITTDSLYPTGALLQDNTTGGVYYVEDGIKSPVWSREIMDINYPNKSLTAVSPDILEKFPTAPGVKLRDGVLVKTADSPDVYVVSNKELRKISNETTFLSLGYEWHDIKTVSQKLFSVHAIGEEIDTVSQTAIALTR